MVSGISVCESEEVTLKSADYKSVSGCCEVRLRDDKCFIHDAQDASVWEGLDGQTNEQEEDLDDEEINRILDEIDDEEDQGTISMEDSTFTHLCDVSF